MSDAQFAALATARGSAVLSFVRDFMASEADRLRLAAEQSLSADDGPRRRMIRVLSAGVDVFTQLVAAGQAANFAAIEAKQKGKEQPWRSAYMLEFLAQAADQARVALVPPEEKEGTEDAAA